MHTVFNYCGKLKKKKKLFYRNNLLKDNNSDKIFEPNLH